MPSSPATSSGYTSINLTTQSESVPLVEATRLATGSPLIFMGVVRTSEVNTATSGRLTRVVDQPLRPGEATAVPNRLNGTGAERHWLRGVRDIFVERGIAGLGSGQTKL